MDVSARLLLACLVGLALIAVGAALANWARDRSLRRSGRAHNLRAQRGEAEAERLLVERGFTIVGRQVRASYPVLLDGSERAVELIADLLVERAGRRLVAEIKTGKHGPRFAYADTRRQMLEYQLAFEVPGVLLVDIEARSVSEARFPLAAPRRNRSAWWWLATAAAGGALWLLQSGALLGR